MILTAHPAAVVAASCNLETDVKGLRVTVEREYRAPYSEPACARIRNSDWRGQVFWVGRGTRWEVAFSLWRHRGARAPCRSCAISLPGPEELFDDLGGHRHEHPTEDVVRLVVAPDEDVDQNEVETEGNGDGGYREDGSGESVPQRRRTFSRRKARPRRRAASWTEGVAAEGMSAPPVWTEAFTQTWTRKVRAASREPPRHIDGSGGQKPDEPTRRRVRAGGEEKSVPRRKKNFEKLGWAKSRELPAPLTTKAPP